MRIAVTSPTLGLMTKEPTRMVITKVPRRHMMEVPTHIFDLAKELDAYSVGSTPFRKTSS